ncbi:MAG TPA: hypothetical protein VES95_06220 [Dermatophilaceae bacterium]|nr:hypothetical protein [Dermatophilaceae bacterium]
MVASHLDFVDVVVADRDLVVTSSDDHVCRLEPRESDLAWYCDLDDGTPTADDRDPASFVRWVCPALRVGRPATGTDIPLVDVRRPGPHSDLGRLIKGFGRLAGRASRRPAEADTEGRFVYADPAGILDVALRRRIEGWPSARHGDGVVRPAELWSIRRNSEGLVVESVSWWGSAPALDHQIGLAVDIAHRLAARR